MKKPFDLLTEFGKFGLEQKISLRDPAASSKFLHHVKGEIERALDDSVLVHGQRTEAMFEALLIGLGGFKLLKVEDNGRVFPTGSYLIPDFRVVLNDGAHWLIEVKNVYESDPSQQRRRLFTKSHLANLTAYAEATSVELKIAGFWARWSMWTLVSPSCLIEIDDRLYLDMPTAIRKNDLSRLGDRIIGTRPPFRLRLAMDPERTGSVNANGEVHATINDVKIFCVDEELIEPVERQIAWLLMQYGDWRADGPVPILDHDCLLAIEFRWEPEEPAGQGFEFVGTLSRMFTRYYAEHTVDRGDVVQLRAPPRPNWFAPLVNMNGGSRALPLWQFIQQPDFDTPADKTSNGGSG